MESVINKIVKEINKSNRVVMYSVSSGFTTQIGVDSGSNIYVSGFPVRKRPSTSGTA
jgi:hypothetical protein